MLVLQRLEDEVCVLTTPNGRRIEIKVLAIRMRQDGTRAVRLGFDADDDVEINRLEVQNEIDAGRDRVAAVEAGEG